MQRGFFSIVLTLAVISFLAKDMHLNNLIYGGMQDVRNDVALGMAINEEIYGLENGFFLTVKDALRSIPMIPTADERAREALAREYVCIKIQEWFNNYPDYSMYVGYIDPADYSRAPVAGSVAQPCLNFVYIDLQEKAFMIKDNGLIEFPYELAGYRIVFMFEGNASGVPFRTIIPEGTVIQ